MSAIVLPTKRQSQALSSDGSRLLMALTFSRRDSNCSDRSPRLDRQIQRRSIRRRPSSCKPQRWEK